MKKSRIKLNLRLFCLIIIFCMLTAVSAEAASKKPETIVVGYYELERNMSGAYEGGTKSGYAYEYLQELASINSWRYEYVYGSFSELYSKLLRGEIDILPCVSYSDERARRVLFSNFEISEEHVSLYASTTTGLNPYFAETFAGRVFGVVSGSASGTVLENWAENNSIEITIIQYPSGVELWNAFESGAVDLAAEKEENAPEGYTRLMRLDTLDSRFAVAPGKYNILNTINEANNLLFEIDPYRISHLKERYYSDVLSVNTLSSDESAWLLKHGTVRAGGLTDDAPYSFYDSTGSASGTLPDILSMIFSKLAPGISVEWTLYPSLKELHAALDSGEIDLACPEYRSHSIAEENGFCLSDAILSAHPDMMYATGTSGTHTSRIAVVENHPAQYYVSDVFPKAQLVLCSSTEECLRKVLKGEADSAVSQTFELQRHLPGYSDSITTSTLSQTCDICFSSRTEDYPLMRIIGRGINSIGDAQISSLELSYMIEGERDYSVAGFIRQHYLAVSALAVVIIGIFFMLLSRVRIAGREKQHEHELLIHEQDQREEFERNLVERTAELHDKNRELARNSDEIFELIGTIVDRRSEKTKNHTQHIKAYTHIISECVRTTYPEYGLSEEVVSMITSASVLHDIGKILIPDSILHKPGPLTDGEYETIKTHSRLGSELFNNPRLSQNKLFFSVCREICLYHHERWDGNGYPFGLRGNEIPISAQIVSVADVFDALVSGREYRGPYSPEISFEMIMSGDCGKFSPKILSCLKKSREQILKAYEEPDTALAERQTEFSAGSSKLTGMRFLLVDDDILSRRLNREILEDEGAVITEAANGREAVEIFNSDSKFDAVLMDIVMPVVDGIEATRLIRDIESAGDTGDSVPIITITADKTEKIVSDAVNAGADACIEKPLVIYELTNALIASMKIHAANMERRLQTTIEIANTDGLTKVRNIMAYTDAVSKLTEEIEKNEGLEFAIIMADLNDLKHVNDTYGHDTGDKYIINCSSLLCMAFPHSPVYRIGGDEFAVILQGIDYSDREIRFMALIDRIRDSEKLDFNEGGTSFAVGMSTYDARKDTAVSEVIKRADREMYSYKKTMKESRK